MINPTMDDHQWASLWRFHYQRLKNNAQGYLDDDDEEQHLITTPTPLQRRCRRWQPWRRLVGKRRFRVRVSGLRKVFRRKRRRRRKSRVFSGLKVLWEKLKSNHQVYLNDLFGGNFLFMHVMNP
ncbi:hypothetical protein L6452_39692 [Arctium lappa]|uniref:Uncharacterized protein n=1 Tax=Arctium lappa TaxID=4217 RepID=A0ACB8XTK9_ARCLA|nr:hypothetical protein L6452_39692 [Arctium lappa]